MLLRFLVMASGVCMPGAFLYTPRLMFGGAYVAKRIASRTRERAQIELDKLSDGAVVIDCHGAAWQLGRVYWYRAYGGDVATPSYDLSFRRPFKVVWHGEEV